MENIINTGMFNTDERIVINSISKGIKLSDFSRKNFIENIAFSRMITNDTDIDILNLLESLHSKISSITDEEWEMLKKYLPLNVPYDIADIVNAFAEP